MPISSNQENDKFKSFTLTNSVRGEDLTRSLVKAMGDIKDFLAQFNGPFALSAATVGQSEHNTVDQFTKDGVTILSRLAASNPEEELSRRLIEFIGKRVDAKCHDGTTTSMMTAASLAYHWTRVLSDKNRRDRRSAMDEISSIIDQMEESVEKYSFTVDELIQAVRHKNKDLTPEDIRRRVYYDTVMTSSKGDTELAEKLTEVLMSLPEELYSYTRFETSNKETKDRYTVVYQEEDIHLRGNIQNNTALLPGNKYMGTVYDMEKAYLTVTGNEVTDGTAEAIFLTEWITNRYLPTVEKSLDEEGKEKRELLPPVDELDRPLVILSRNAANGNLIRVVNLYNNYQKDWNKRIFLYQFYAEENRSYPAVATTLANIAMGENGEEYITLTEALSYNDLTPAMIPCSFMGSTNVIEISNLYKRDGRRFHPYYYDESKTRYHDFIKEMQDTLEFQTNRHLDTNKRSVKFTEDVIYLLRCAICQDIKELRIGSTTHELFNNFTVVEDALGSAMSVVEDGVILSGYQKILRDLAVKFQWSPTKSNHVPDSLESATITALKEVVTATYDLTENEFEDNFKSLVKFNNRKSLKYMYNNAFDKAPYTPRDAVAEFANGTSCAVLQPVVGFKEQLIRVRDIVSKLIFTYAILTAKTFQPLV